MKKTLFVLASLFVSSLAMAQASMWSCDLNFTAKGGGAQILFGDYELQGLGDLKCKNGFGEQANLPIKIKMGTAPIDLRVGFGYMKILGTSFNIPLFSYNPLELIGEYALVQANAAVGLGAGVFVGKSLKLIDFSIPVSIKLLSGFGVDVGLSNMIIDIDHSRLQ